MTLQHNYLIVPLPSDWEDASQVIALGPEDGGFRPNLVFSQEPVNGRETARDFAARQLPQLQAALNYYYVVDERDARFGPNVGYLREHTFVTTPGDASTTVDAALVDIAQLQFYVVLAGRCYTFTFTHLKERLPTVRAAAERMFAQAKIAVPNAAIEDDF